MHTLRNVTPLSTSAPLLSNPLSLPKALMTSLTLNNKLINNCCRPCSLLLSNPTNYDVKRLRTVGGRNNVPVLWQIRAQILKNYHIPLRAFDVYLGWSFSGNRRPKKETIKLCPSSRRLYSLFPYRQYGSRPICVREIAQSVCKRKRLFPRS